MKIIEPDVSIAITRPKSIDKSKKKLFEKDYYYLLKHNSRHPTCRSRTGYRKELGYEIY